jgi:hypothetical protein
MSSDQHPLPTGGIHQGAPLLRFASLIFHSTDCPGLQRNPSCWHSSDSSQMAQRLLAQTPNVVCTTSAIVPCALEPNVTASTIPIAGTGNFVDDSNRAQLVRVATHILYLGHQQTQPIRPSPRNTLSSLLRSDRCHKNHFGGDLCTRIHSPLLGMLSYQSQMTPGYC